MTVTGSEFASRIQPVYEYLEDPKAEVRAAAAQIIAGLSLEEDQMRPMVASEPVRFVGPLVAHLRDHPQIAATCWDALINLAAEEVVALCLVDLHMDQALAEVKSRDSIFAEAATKLLSNMSKVAARRIDKFAAALPDLMPIYLAGPKYNKNCDYEFLASVIADVTSVKEIRQYLMDDLSRVAALLPDLHSASVIRRGGIVATVKNCLFDVGYHDLILAREEEDDFLVTSLAGRLLDSRSKLNSDEQDKLPLELQLLDALQAEPDLVIRSILIECLIILGATRPGRETMRRKGIYPILREWHLLELSEDLKALLEKLVELLIRDEEPLPQK